MDDAQRLAYEERREDERRQEREREEACREELEQEDARRLARYDEALNTISFLVAMFGEFDSDGKPDQASDGKDAAMQRALDFLAAEGKVAG